MAGVGRELEWIGCWVGLALLGLAWVETRRAWYYGLGWRGLGRSCSLIKLSHYCGDEENPRSHSYIDYVFMSVNMSGL